MFLRFEKNVPSAEARWEVLQPETWQRAEGTCQREKFKFNTFIKMLKNDYLGNL